QCRSGGGEAPRVRRIRGGVNLNLRKAERAVAVARGSKSRLDLLTRDYLLLALQVAFASLHWRLPTHFSRLLRCSEHGRGKPPTKTHAAESERISGGSATEARPFSARPRAPRNSALRQERPAHRDEKLRVGACTDSEFASRLGTARGASVQVEEALFLRTVDGRLLRLSDSPALCANARDACGESEKGDLHGDSWPSLWVSEDKPRCFACNASPTECACPRFSPRYALIAEDEPTLALILLLLLEASPSQSLTMADVDALLVLPRGVIRCGAGAAGGRDAVCSVFPLPAAEDLGAASLSGAPERKKRKSLPSLSCDRLSLFPAPSSSSSSFSSSSFSSRLPSCQAQTDSASSTCGASKFANASSSSLLRHHFRAVPDPELAHAAATLARLDRVCRKRKCDVGFVAVSEDRVRLICEDRVALKRKLEAHFGVSMSSLSPPFSVSSAGSAVAGEAHEGTRREQAKDGEKKVSQAATDEGDPRRKSRRGCAVDEEGKREIGEVGGEQKAGKSGKRRSEDEESFRQAVGRRDGDETPFLQMHTTEEEQSGVSTAGRRRGFRRGSVLGSEGLERRLLQELSEHRDPVESPGKPSSPSPAVVPEKQAEGASISAARVAAQDPQTERRAAERRAAPSKPGVASIDAQSHAVTRSVPRVVLADWVQPRVCERRRGWRSSEQSDRGGMSAGRGGDAVVKGGAKETPCREEAEKAPHAQDNAVDEEGERLGREELVGYRGSMPHCVLREEKKEWKERLVFGLDSEKLTKKRKRGGSENTEKPEGEQLRSVEDASLFLETTQKKSKSPLSSVASLFCSFLPSPLSGALSSNIRDALHHARRSVARPLSAFCSLSSPSLSSSLSSPSSVSYSPCSLSPFSSSNVTDRASTAASHSPPRRLASASAAPTPSRFSHANASSLTPQAPPDGERLCLSCVPASFSPSSPSSSSEKRRRLESVSGDRAPRDEAAQRERSLTAPTWSAEEPKRAKRRSGKDPESEPAALNAECMGACISACMQPRKLPALAIVDRARLSPAELPKYLRDHLEDACSSETLSLDLDEVAGGSFLKDARREAGEKRRGLLVERRIRAQGVSPLTRQLGTISGTLLPSVSRRQVRGLSEMQQAASASLASLLSLSRPSPGALSGRYTRELSVSPTESGLPQASPPLRSANTTVSSSSSPLSFSPASSASSSSASSMDSNGGSSAGAGATLSGSGRSPNISRIASAFEEEARRRGESDGLEGLAGRWWFVGGREEREGRRDPGRVEGEESGRFSEDPSESAASLGAAGVAGRLHTLLESLIVDLWTRGATAERSHRHRVSRSLRQGPGDTPETVQIDQETVQRDPETVPRDLEAVQIGPERDQEADEANRAMGEETGEVGQEVEEETGEPEVGAEVSGDSTERGSPQQQPHAFVLPQRRGTSVDADEASSSSDSSDSLSDADASESADSLAEEDGELEGGDEAWDFTWATEDSLSQANSGASPEEDSSAGEGDDIYEDDYEEDDEED
ncbi:hypothetical protein TGRUB_253990B, partial [Toxoplasma gondii RUB]